MKKILNLLAISFLVTSCTKEDLTSENKTIESRFNSIEQVEVKISEIEAFRNNQDNSINQNLFQFDKFTNENSHNNKKELSKSDEKSIIDHVSQYHQAKLNAIYEERNHFGFTSIQSIADEINFLKLLNREKSNQLFEQYKKFLTKDELITTTIFNNHYAVLINTNGELLINKTNIASQLIKKSSKTSSTNKSLSSNIFATGYNGFIKITYSTDLEYSTFSYIERYETAYDVNGNWISIPIYKTVNTYKPSTLLSNFVLSPYGYVLYNCYFYTNPNSYATFNVSNRTHTLGFASGIGNYVINNGGTFGYDTYNTPESVSGFVGGNFAIPIAGTSSFLWVAGQQNF